MHAKNFGNVRFVRDESVHIVNTKNCVQCKSKVHTKARIVGLCTIMYELWEVLCVLWEVYTIEVVRIVGGAMGFVGGIHDRSCTCCGRCYESCGRYTR